MFHPRPVLLFTATPYREDGRSRPGRPIYRFPLREAQSDGYFTRIEYRAVSSLEGVDSALPTWRSNGCAPTWLSVMTTS